MSQMDELFSYLGEIWIVTTHVVFLEVQKVGSTKSEAHISFSLPTIAELAESLTRLDISEENVVIMYVSTAITR